MPGPGPNHAQTAAHLAILNKSPDVTVPHWHITTPNGLNWSKTFPYQLLVVKNSGSGYVEDTRWSFTLPLGLQDLQISAPFAHSLQITQNGAVEQRGGMPVRQIRASGTTGVLPLRPNAEMQPFRPSQALFGGTISQSLGGVAPAVNAVSRDLLPSASFLSVISEAEMGPGSDIAVTSGYYQFRLLQQFLERYAQVAKTDAGKDLRLALACWKDEAVYLISPQEFTVSRRVSRPRHYDFSFTARGFARVSLDKQVAAVEAPLPLSQDPGAVSRALQTVRDSRRVLAASRATLAAISADLADAVTTPLREVSLFLQETGATAAAISDFPATLIRAAKRPILELMAVRDASTNIPSRLMGNASTTSKAVEELRRLGSLLGKSDSRSGDAAAPQSLTSDPANSIFDDPDQYFDLFSAIQLGDLRLSSQVISAVAAERARVATFQRSDFIARRAAIQLASYALADAVGLGNPIAALIAGKTLPPPVRVASDSDREILFALNSAAQVLDSLAVRAPGLPGPQRAALDFVGGLARQAGLPFGQAPSKRAIPFPYGVSLEALASQYLGDPERWHEIATLNQLRSPYIDESGSSTQLLVGGSGSQLSIAWGYAQNLRPGQVVTVASRTVPQLRTVVLRVSRAGESGIVTVSDAVDRYSASDGAVLHSYLPDTVNSRMLLWVPSDEAPDDQVDELVSPTDLDPLVRAAGADWLLDPSNGLVVTPDGDFPLARGLTLVVQAVRLALSTCRGTLLHHPNFGLPPSVGESLAILDAKTLARAIRDLFDGDPLFKGIEGVAVKQEGPVSSIGMSVAVRGLDRPLPVSVQLSQ